MTSISQEKANLRNLFARKRTEIPIEERDKLNNQIQVLLTSQDFYRESNSIFIFVSFRSEVDTIAIITTSLQQGKKIFVPRTMDAKGNMEAVEIENLEQLKPGRMGLLEPEPHLAPIATPSFDLILVPGLAFDKAGYRLGYGGGFYDKFLGNLPEHGLTLGLAYSVQLTENLPSAAHDQKLNGVITEKGVTILQE